MYTTINFKTKKALKEAVAAGQRITVYQPGPFAKPGPITGRVSVEGPHYPEPHSWYADCLVENSVVIAVK